MSPISTRCSTNQHSLPRPNAQTDASIRSVTGCRIRIEKFWRDQVTPSGRGERNVLIASLDSLLRVASNPFFPYMIERIDEEREGGRDLAEALVVASRARFRPILMTTLTTVAGLMPRRWAISLFDRPLPTNWAISPSRPAAPRA